MKTTIDAAGRIVIPSEIRRDAGFNAGMEVEVRFRGGVVELEATATPVKMVRRGKLLVAVGGEKASLSERVVRATRDALRGPRQR